MTETQKESLFGAMDLKMTTTSGILVSQIITEIKKTVYISKRALASLVMIGVINYFNLPVKNLVLATETVDLQ